jgi:hypothetical protein
MLTPLALAGSACNWLNKLDELALNMFAGLLDVRIGQDIGRGFEISTGKPRI